MSIFWPLFNESFATAAAPKIFFYQLIHDEKEKYDLISDFLHLQHKIELEYVTNIDSLT